MPTQILLEGATFARDDRILLGEGLFETLKVTDSKPCNAFLHWQRLSVSAHKVGICFDLTFDIWQAHLEAQIKADALVHGGIKAILSAGAAPRGLAQKGKVSQLFFHSFQYNPSDKPLRLISASWLRDAANPIYQVKSVNYLEAILARRQALAQDVDDALFFNTNHHATETTCANFFLIKAGGVFTPRVTDGVLPGITRARIASLCAKEGIFYTETALTKAQIADADAVFTSNCLQGIKGGISLDTMQFVVTHPLIAYLSEHLT